jgi:hypothetical protein
MSSNASSTQGPIAAFPLSGTSLVSTKSRSRFLWMRAMCPRQVAAFDLTPTLVWSRKRRQTP